ncbi:hypothetical protein L484_010151 [Morus notabilis]|uniref:Uncharacterized protein n=1 Tax=Morus notabilis TaxID=981085 RepID=W9R9C6_9ROSA|nr:hypothetical protein L484_010151 [Morus notabilis]
MPAKGENNRQQEIPKIQKVPDIMLRNADHFSTLFEPMELSIGPLYGPNDKLYKWDLKVKLAAHFIKRRGDTTEHDLLQKVKKVDIKKYFDDKVIQDYRTDDQELFRLVFLDGCAILEFIYSYVYHGLHEFDIISGQAALIRQDLFLLQNQIPFEVLEVLMEKCTTEASAWREDFLIFILMSSIISPGDSSKLLRSCMAIFSSNGNEKPVHILDFLRRVLLIQTRPIYRPRNQMTIACDFFWLLCTFGVPIMLTYMMKCIRKSAKRQDYSGNKQSFRNVQELKTAGIKFNRCDSLANISFHTPSFITGQLVLPSLVVDSSTERKLFNLIALEMCLLDHQDRRPDTHKSWVNSYINLLDLFIDNEHDVKALRAAHLLRNGLSSDIEVAQLINRVGSKCPADPPVDTYADVKRKIEEHYRNRCAIWMAQARHTHFHSHYANLV